MRCPRIYSHGTNLLIRFVGNPDLAEQVGVDVAELNDPDGSIPLVSHYDLVEAAVEYSQDPLLGLHFGAVDMAESRPGAGAIGHLFFASPNLRVSLIKLIEYQASWNPGERYDVSEYGQELLLRYRCWGPKRKAHDQQALRNAAALVGIRKLVEGGVKFNSVRFEMPRSEWSREVEELLACPVEFDAGINEFAMPLELLMRPMPTADADVFRYAEGLLDRQRAKSRDVPSYTVIARTEIEKQGLKDVGDLALLVSRQLGCSVRTLQRRLAEEGTSMSMLIDDARRGSSLDLLRTDLTLEEVAHELGYTETASIRRAFQRWHGHSPTVWRRRLDGRGAAPEGVVARINFKPTRRI